MLLMKASPAERRSVPSTLSSLPSIFRTPLQQPLFVLGVLFILVVFFVPGGLARAGRMRRALRLST